MVEEGKEREYGESCGDACVYDVGGGFGGGEGGEEGGLLCYVLTRGGGRGGSGRARYLLRPSRRGRCRSGSRRKGI